MGDKEVDLNKSKRNVEKERRKQRFRKEVEGNVENLNDSTNIWRKSNFSSDMWRDPPGRKNKSPEGGNFMHAHACVFYGELVSPSYGKEVHLSSITLVVSLGTDFIGDPSKFLQDRRVKFKWLIVYKAASPYSSNSEVIRKTRLVENKTLQGPYCPGEDKISISHK